MPSHRTLGAITTLALALVVAREDEAHAEPPPCSSSITRDNVAVCVLAASPAIRVESATVAASVARRAAAAPWFPSNPTLSLTGASRAGTEGRGATINYAASLSQEIEIAGQRTSRRNAADAEVGARREDAIARSRQIAATAYVAWFESIAAHEALLVAQRLDATGRQIATITRARADAGVLSPLDAEVAEAASLRITQNRLATDRAARTADATLASLLGRDPIASPTAAAGALEPLDFAESFATSIRAPANAAGGQREGARALAMSARPEVRALALDRQAFELRAQGFRRARFPSLTLQVFAQNDGYNERVLGAGLSFPIPLPQPLGRLYAGEIAENEALARQRSAEADRTVRQMTNELATALVSYETHRAEAQLYTSVRVAHAEQLLGEIGAEIEKGRLPVRDAVVAEQQLIDVMRGYVEARRAWCVASVDLALAAGAPLETGAPPK